MKSFESTKILQIDSNPSGIRMIETKLKGTFLSVKLIEYREKKNMTQADVANALYSINRTAISNWETGKSVPSLKTFVFLCELYDVTPNDMLGFYEKL